MNCGFWTYDGKYLIAAPLELGNVGDTLIFRVDKTGDGQADYEETFYIGDLEANYKTPNQKEGKPQIEFLVKKPDKKEGLKKIETAEQMIEDIYRTLKQFPIYGGTILSVKNTGKNILTGENIGKFTTYYDYLTGTQTTNYDVRDKNFEIGIGKINLSSRYGYQYENQPVKINGMTAVQVNRRTRI